VTDFLEEKRREIDARLKELKPLVDEYNRLEAASQALAGVGTNGARSTSGTATRTRRASTTTRKPSTGTGRRGRPKGSGNRANEALELIKSRPGITIPEMAEAMGIKQNYLYRVVPGLQKDGKVTKSGKGWHIRG
jgi:sugar-specific transcriptional regulator TrmB